MSLRLFSWAMEHYAIPSDEKFVLLALAECSDDDNNTWTGTWGGLSRFTNLDGGQILDAIDRLTDRGLILRPGGAIVMAAPVREYSHFPSTEFKKKPISKTTRLLVMHRDNHQCQHCGAEDDLTIDHIHPESKGGTNALENLQVLCRRCNCSKGVKVPA